MDFLDMFAKPVRAVKRAFDFDADFGSSSLAGQLAAAKSQLTQLQRQLIETNRIAREKDLLIEKLQRALAAKTVRPPVVPTSEPNDRKDADATSASAPKQIRKAEAVSSKKAEEASASASLETSRPTVEPRNRAATEPTDTPAEETKPKRRRSSTTSRKKKAEPVAKAEPKAKKTTRRRTAPAKKTTPRKAAAKVKTATKPKSSGK